MEPRTVMICRSYIDKPASLGRQWDLIIGGQGVECECWVEVLDNQKKLKMIVVYNFF